LRIGVAATYVALEVAWRRDMAFSSNDQLDVEASVEGFESNAYWVDIQRKAAGDKDISYISTDYAKRQLKEWEKFKAKLKPGDELWYYTASMESYGIVLMRNGKAIADFVISDK
jgi:predicted thioesterase